MPAPYLGLPFPLVGCPNTSRSHSHCWEQVAATLEESQVGGGVTVATISSRVAQAWDQEGAGAQGLRGKVEDSACAQGTAEWHGAAILRKGVFGPPNLPPCLTVAFFRSQNPHLPEQPWFATMGSEEEHH